MNTPRCCAFGVLLIALLAGVYFLTPGNHQTLFGILKGERFFRGRPKSYWRKAILDGSMYFDGWEGKACVEKQKFDACHVQRLLQAQISVLGQSDGVPNHAAATAVGKDSPQALSE